MKNLMYTAFVALLATSCLSDDDTELPPYEPVIIGEQFNMGADNTILVTEGWLNIAQTGSAVWKIQKYSGNGYAEFSSFQSGNDVNVGWLISPAFELPENNSRILNFEVAQSYVTSADNTFEVFISTDFNGTNLDTATWTRLDADTPGTNAVYFEFMDSGDISLANFSGTAYIGFKVVGSGNNSALDGSYQVDNVFIH
ncbi:choice-of-anchor J domain-containing protein [Flavobacterium rhizosphaerae]|uniref:Choice-of-anchor J domain-containing protein n=1 Tax=Flavobacterium rhizosphaerae TaxID=3163298 RepID=A0ABW8YUV6_9FLAO